MRGPFRPGSDTSPSVSVASTSATSVATVSEWAAMAAAASPRRVQLVRVRERSALGPFEHGGRGQRRAGAVYIRVLIVSRDFTNALYPQGHRPLLGSPGRSRTTRAHLQPNTSGRHWAKFIYGPM
jgi:hypothetical protein